MKETIPISKFKTVSPVLQDQVIKTGRPIMVTKKGKPIAQMIPPSAPKKTGNWLGSFKSTGKITGDIVSPLLEET